MTFKHLLTTSLVAISAVSVAHAETNPAEIVVTALGGQAGAPAASNRLGVSLQNMPQAATVLTSELIRAQNADTLEEVLHNVPGVIQTSGHSGIFSNYVVRGFQLDNNASYFKDSLRFDRQSQLSLQNIEQVEVVRGPASLQYGKLVPGGFVNFVTKKPQESARHQVTAYLSSFGQVEGGFDSTGKLTDDGRILYRFNAEAKHLDSFRRHVDGEAYMVSPALTFRLGEATRLEITTEHNWLDTIRDPGQPAPDGATIASVTRLSPKLFYGETDAKNEVESHSGTVRFNHQLGEDWEVRLDYVRSYFDRDMFFTLNLNPLNGMVRRRSNTSVTEQRSESMRAEVFGRFSTGAISHRLLVGADRLNRRFKETYGTVTVIPSVDLFDPQPAGNVVYDRTLTETDRVRAHDGGIYVQDQMQLGKLDLMLGLRHDWLDERLSVDDLTGPVTFSSRINAKQFSPSAGVVYRLLPQLSLYANYSRSLDANVAFDGCGRTFEPSRGTQYEGGVKGSAFGDRLQWAVAAFDLRRTNALVDDPSGTVDPATGSTCQIAAGEQRSTGFELEASGYIARGLRLHGAFTHLSARVSEDPDASIIGRKLRNAPRNSARLWGEYSFGGPLDGLSASLGITYVGCRFANDANTLTIPSHTVWDAGARYKLNESHSIAVAVEDAGQNVRSINQRAPRSLSLRYIGSF
jgi:iron complex outermembrane receptor protein